MSSAVPKPCLPIGYEELLRLSAKLGPEALGYAVQIIAYQSHCGSGLPDDIAPRHLRVTSRRWEKLRPLLAQALELREGRWGLAGAAACEAAAEGDPAWPEPQVRRRHPLEPPKTAAVEPARRRRPGGLPLAFEEPTGPKSAMPILPVPPEPKSLAQNVFDLGVRLLTSTGRSETAARALIAKLLQKYDVGYVAAALNDAWRSRTQIVEPYSWISRRMDKYPTKEAEKSGGASRGARKAAAHPAATAEFLGISSGMADRIRKDKTKAFRFEPDDGADGAEAGGGGKERG